MAEQLKITFFCDFPYLIIHIIHLVRSGEEARSTNRGGKAERHPPWGGKELRRPAWSGEELRQPAWGGKATFLEVVD